VRQVWFWMGICQDLIGHWTSVTDILQYTGSLLGKDRCAFGTMLSAVCWTIWKYRNEVIFKQSDTTVRNTIILTISSSY
jgi:hypothetical protein